MNNHNINTINIYDTFYINVFWKTNNWYTFYIYKRYTFIIKKKLNKKLRIIFINIKMYKHYILFNIYITENHENLLK